MSVGLSIVFTGLCAFVSGGDGSGQVLLVDAPGVGEVGGALLPEHAPTLVVPLASLANADSSRPDRVFVADGQWGLWDLRGARVRLRIQGTPPAGLRVHRGTAETSSWPEPPRDGASGWRDIRYVADMRSLVADGRVDPSLVEESESDQRLPSAIATRILLDAGLMEAGVPSHAGHRDDVFEFIAPGGASRLRQALTDSLRWSLDGAAAVVVEIAPVDGAPVRRLVLVPRSEPHALYVSNMPVETHASHGPSPGAGTSGAEHAAMLERAAALHFGAYYKLLRNRPLEEPLLRPWEGPSLRKGNGIAGPLMCPPAVFARD
jgi:hypothetical protein